MSRERFGSNRATIMALAGSAIGLGNIWRFPYMLGQNGGSAFIIIYIASILLLSLPIFLSEAVIGSSTRCNTFGAMKTLAPGSRWKYLGLLTVLTPLVLLSYYSVIGGWSVGYLAKSTVGGFQKDVSTFYTNFTSSPLKAILCHTIFLGTTSLIVLGGVKKGIERFNKISIPVLFFLIVGIAIYVATLPGASQGYAYMLKPDWSGVTAGTAAAAMGQGFFSLSLGVGTVLTYTSYMNKGGSIVRTGIWTAIFDLAFALIAGFAIMPAVFAAGIEPGAGPGLIFETLPYIFTQMSPLIGRILSIVFFFTILIAALTSSISMCEVGVAYLEQEKGISRKKAVALIFVCTWTLGIVCALAFGPLKDVKLMGLDIFSFLDYLTSNFLMSFGALLFVIFVGWKMKKETVRDCFLNKRLFHFFYFLIRYIAPLGIIVIFLTNL